MFVSSNEKERDSATIFRMCKHYLKYSLRSEIIFLIIIKLAFEMIGILAGLGIMAPFSTIECKTLPTVSPEYSTSAFEDLTTKQTDIFADDTVWDKHKLVFISLIISVLFTIGNILLLVFVKERTG
jgi:hypothetical protein